MKYHKSLNHLKHLLKWFPLKWLAGLLLFHHIWDHFRNLRSDSMKRSFVLHIRCDPKIFQTNYKELQLRTKNRKMQYLNCGVVIFLLTWKPRLGFTQNPSSIPGLSSFLLSAFSLRRTSQYIWSPSSQKSSGPVNIGAISEKFLVHFWSFKVLVRWIKSKITYSLLRF